jgi:hypothetical protein
MLTTILDASSRRYHRSVCPPQTSSSRCRSGRCRAGVRQWRPWGRGREAVDGLHQRRATACLPFLSSGLHRRRGRAPVRAPSQPSNVGSGNREQAATRGTAGGGSADRRVEARAAGNDGGATAQRVPSNQVHAPGSDAHSTAARFAWPRRSIPPPLDSPGRAARFRRRSVPPPLDSCGCLFLSARWPAAAASPSPHERCGRRARNNRCGCAGGREGAGRRARRRFRGRAIQGAGQEINAGGGSLAGQRR